MQKGKRVLPFINDQYFKESTFDIFQILTRLFRVFVHVYIHHFDRLVAIGMLIPQ